MKKIAQLSLVAAALVAGQAANALSFQTVANSSFTEYFTLTPVTTNRFALSVSGLAEQFSALNFEILSGGPAVTGTLVNGSLVGAFNDARNAGYTLTGGTSYVLKITGTTKANPPGLYGLVSIGTLNGAVTPVPEPESYAMLLAGLGLVGTIARRRMKIKAEA